MATVYITRAVRATTFAERPVGQDHVRVMCAHDGWISAPPPVASEPTRLLLARQGQRDDVVGLLDAIRPLLGDVPERIEWFETVSRDV